MVATKRLDSVEAVLGALGGLDVVQDLTEAATRNTVWNWTYLGRFPSNTYWILDKELKKRGYKAEPSLWRMKGELK